jgi:hypothetical protein
MYWESENLRVKLFNYFWWESEGHRIIFHESDKPWDFFFHFFWGRVVKEDSREGEGMSKMMDQWFQKAKPGDKGLTRPPASARVSEHKNEVRSIARGFFQIQFRVPAYKHVNPISPIYLLWECSCKLIIYCERHVPELNNYLLNSFTAYGTLNNKIPKECVQRDREAHIFFWKKNLKKIKKMINRQKKIKKIKKMPC